MDDSVLLFGVFVSLFCDLMGIRYRGVTYFILGGMVSLLALANLIHDGSFTIQRDLIQSSGMYATYSLTLANNLADMVLIAGALAVFTIAQFLFVIERQTK